MNNNISDYYYSNLLSLTIFCDNSQVLMHNGVELSESSRNKYIIIPNSLCDSNFYYICPAGIFKAHVDTLLHNIDIGLSFTASLINASSYLCNIIFDYNNYIDSFIFLNNNNMTLTFISKHLGIVNHNIIDKSYYFVLFDKNDIVYIDSSNELSGAMWGDFIDCRLSDNSLYFSLIVSNNDCNYLYIFDINDYSLLYHSDDYFINCNSFFYNNYFIIYMRFGDEENPSRPFVIIDLLNNNVFNRDITIDNIDGYFNFSHIGVCDNIIFSLCNYFHMFKEDDLILNNSFIFAFKIDDLLFRNNIKFLKWYYIFDSYIHDNIIKIIDDNFVFYSNNNDIFIKSMNFLIDDNTITKSKFLRTDIDGIWNEFIYYEHEETYRNIVDWIIQFDHDKRNIILEEISNIFSNFYTNESGLHIFSTHLFYYLKKIFDKKYKIDFFSNMQLINHNIISCNNTGLLNCINNNIFFYNINKPLSNKYSVYIDDILCTGEYFRHNIEYWLKSDFSDDYTNYEALTNGDTQLILIFLHADRGRLMSILLEIIDKYTFNPKHEIIIIDHNDVYNVTQFNSRIEIFNKFTDSTVEFLCNITTSSKPSIELTISHDNIMDYYNSLLSDIKLTNRDILELEILKKGYQIIEDSKTKNPKLRPLGYLTRESHSMGFGSLIFTFMNIPRTSPLVFWYETDNFKPLLSNRDITES